MVEYLEEHGIKVYSPRSEMFFERKEIKQVIGCMILCFPEYVRKLQQKRFFRMILKISIIITILNV